MTAAPIASELTIPSDRTEAWYAREVITFALQAMGYPGDDACLILIAVEEALVNAIIHGNQNDPAKRIEIAFTATTEQFNVRIEDEGAGFDYRHWFDPPDPLDPIVFEPPYGRGLFLMQRFMTEVQFHGRGNVVTMSKVREAAQ